MKSIALRFKEPSSWAGVAVVISVIAPLAGLPSAVGDAVVAVGIALAGLLAVLLPEEHK
jgi:hypothetical protein